MASRVVVAYEPGACACTIAQWPFVGSGVTFTASPMDARGPCRAPTKPEPQRRGMSAIQNRSEAVNAPGSDQRRNAIESRSIDYVPIAERHGRLKDQATIWF